MRLLLVSFWPIKDEVGLNNPIQNDVTLFNWMWNCALIIYFRSEQDSSVMLSNMLSKLDSETDMENGCEQGITYYNYLVCQTIYLYSTEV